MPENTAKHFRRPHAMTWTEYQDRLTLDQLRDAAIDETRQAMASGEMTTTAGEEMIIFLLGVTI